MKNEHRVGVRIKRHRDLRHDKIMDFLDNLPRDENTGEIMKTTLSNHTINALYMYARILAGEVTVIEKTTPDALTSIAMQVMTGQVSPIQHPIQTSTVVTAAPSTVMEHSQSSTGLSATQDTTLAQVNTEEKLPLKESVVMTTQTESVTEDVAQIRTKRPKFGKSLGGG